MEEQTGTEDALFEASDMEAVANDSITEQADEENDIALDMGPHIIFRRRPS